MTPVLARDYLLKDIIRPLLSDAHSISILEQVRKWKDPSDGTTPKKFEGWFQAEIAARIESQGYTVDINPSFDPSLSSCKLLRSKLKGEKLKAKSYSPDIRFKKQNIFINIALKTQIATPLEIYNDILIAEDQNDHHKKLGVSVFFTVATLPPITKSKKWRSFEVELKQKCSTWGSSYEMFKDWLALVYYPA